MYFGAAWYPEHWPESRWAADVQLMQAAGMNVCRIGEFAWSTMEPVESFYVFEWLEHAIELLHSSGIAVVLGTPTAAPPAWLTHHHPDTLAIEASGRTAQHGNRCHYNPGSTTYMKYVRRIVEQMAKRFGKDRRVIGWQLDNEYNRVDYSEDTRRRFQSYLKERYITLEALNRHWSTAYWSQTYSDWREIPIPIGAHNPGLMLGFRHFVTQVWRDYQKLQVDVIRANALPEQWITHNFMGWFDAFDHYDLTEDLDFASWDWYVGTGHNDYRSSGVVHDLTRGFKRKNFWLMETQPGCVNWSPNNNMLNRGEARCMAWHAVAHGADGLLYWQWRSAFGGQEQLHGSLIGVDGAPRPFYEEASEIGAELTAGPVVAALAETEPIHEVAILHSYDSRWSINAQRHNQAFDPVAVLKQYSRPFASRNIGVDVLHSEADLQGYRLIIAPALALITPAAIERLTHYVQSGGTLVLTVRCGQKDEYNALFPALQPGAAALRDLAGVEVEEYYALDNAVPVSCEWDGKPHAGTGAVWAERLRLLSPEAEALAHYGDSNGWLDGYPAAAAGPRHASGGRIILIGALLDEASQESLTDWLIGQTGVIAEWPDRVEGVEVARRRRRGGDPGAPGDRCVTVVINHTQAEQQLPVPSASNFTGGEGSAHSYLDLLTGERAGSVLQLKPYDVKLLVEAD